MTRHLQRKSLISGECDASSFSPGGACEVIRYSARIMGSSKRGGTLSADSIVRIPRLHTSTLSS